MMRPGLHFFAPRGGRVINNYFGMPSFGMGEYWRMQSAMFNCMKPMLIGGMISNIGTTIANLISGNSNGQCNCNHELSQTMYPYVNFTNTTQNSRTTTVEGKGGSDSASDDLKILRDTYKGYKISGPMSDGSYYIKGKDGIPIRVGSYEELTDKLNELAEMDADLNAQPDSESPVLEEEVVQPTQPTAPTAPVTPAKAAAHVTPAASAKHAASAKKKEAPAKADETAKKEETPKTTFKAAKYNPSMKVKMANGSTVERYGYEYANGNKLYSEQSWSKVDSDAVFEIAGHRYNLKLAGQTLDYWDILGQRTQFQSGRIFIDNKNGKFKNNSEHGNYGTLTNYDSKNGPLDKAVIRKNKDGQIVLTYKDKNGKLVDRLMDEVMAGKYNNELK